jgi:hypothetical protein
MSDPVLIALLGNASGIIASIFSGINHFRLKRVAEKQTVIATAIDGRMDQLLDTTKSVAFKDGQETEREKVK